MFPKIYFSLLGLLFINTLSAQSWLNTSNQWRTKKAWCLDFFCEESLVDQYINGDTLINGTEYVQLWEKGIRYNYYINTPEDTLFVDTINQYVGAIRENNKQWFWIEKNSNESHLLYDFNFSSGDSIQIYQHNENLKITLVDSVFINNAFRKRYQLNDWPFHLIEGIGLDIGLTTNLSQFIQLFEFGILYCYEDEGDRVAIDLSALEMTFETEFTDQDCNSEIITPSKEIQVESKITIYPNPTSDILVVSAYEVIEQIIIYDSIGRKMFEQPTHSNTIEVDLQDWSNGMYLIQILVSGNQVSTNTFIKI